VFLPLLWMEMVILPLFLIFVNLASLFHKEDSVCPCSAIVG
jgi:hypothetical protein